MKRNEILDMPLSTVIAAWLLYHLGRLGYFASQEDLISFRKRQLVLLESVSDLKIGEDYPTIRRLCRGIIAKMIDVLNREITLLDLVTILAIGIVEDK